MACKLHRSRHRQYLVSKARRWPSLFNSNSGGLEMTDLIHDRGASGGAVALARVMAPRTSRRQARGAAAARLLVGVVVIVLIAAAAWWYMGRSGTSILPAALAPDAATSGAPDALTPIAATEDLSVNELYKQARAAMSGNRMVNPPGNNALELYLRILAAQPGDATATDALRELFPFATGSAEDQINQGHFDEAGRIMTLLATADPSNYTLTILRSKLEAKKRQSDRELALQTQKDAAATATAARPQTPAAAPNTEAPAPAPAPTPMVAAPAATEVAAATPAPSVAPAPVPPAPVGETREARVVTPPNPGYPAAAVRNRQNGWVEVEFTVAADGSVKSARVTAAEPRGVFDREALSAVQKARFEPRLDRGEPVPSTLRRRIEFKLN